MENETNNFSYGYDEFQCFHIADFQQGDSIIFLNESGEKERGVVTKSSHKDLAIAFQRSGGHMGSCHINDVVLLSEGVRGWLSTGR
jgi:hypothetical protein